MPRFRPSFSLAIASASAATGLLCPCADAAIVSLDKPDFDRWNYPFNATPGSRPSAPTFGAVGAEGFDDRDGQFLIGFDLSQALPALAPGERFELHSVIVTATHALGSFTYDPTYDSYQTHLAEDDPVFLTDDDAGRPIILTGAGLRNGFAGFAFGGAASPPFYVEDTTFAFGDPTAEGVRNAFSASYNGASERVDVSNNVTDAFDFTPFAVGTTDLAPGQTVLQGTPGQSAGSTFTFEVDVTHALIKQDLEAAMQSGGLFFAITSLHGASQSGGSSPNFYTSDNFDPAAIAPTLTLDYSIVPEPSSAALAGLGLLIIASRTRRSRSCEGGTK